MSIHLEKEGKYVEYPSLMESDITDTLYLEGQPVKVWIKVVGW